MFKINDLQRTVTAAIGAVLVSLTLVSAAVGPVRANAAVNVPGESISA